MRKALLPVALAMLVAGGPAFAEEPTRGEAELARIVEGRVAGEPVDCLEQRQIRSSRIVNGTAIVYEVGNTLYVNRPTTGASSLRDGEIMVTDTRSSRLCSIDMVKLYSSSTRMQMGAIGLGKFVPYAKAKAAQ